MFTQKTLRAALTYARTNHPTKMLELFQNNNTSAQYLLGELGPLTATARASQTKQIYRGKVSRLRQTANFRLKFAVSLKSTKLLWFQLILCLWLQFPLEQVRRLYNFFRLENQVIIRREPWRKRQQDWTSQICIFSNKYILLDVLLSSIAEYFYKLCRVLTSSWTKNTFQSSKLHIDSRFSF